MAKQLYHPNLYFRNTKSIESERQFSIGQNTYHWFFNASQRFEHAETWRITIFCPFDFGNFPFDKHECNFTFGTIDNSIKTVKFTPVVIQHNGQKSSLGQPGLDIVSNLLPFNMKITSLETFLVESSDLYSSQVTDHAGFNIQFSRKSLGGLVGGFYGPTAIFAILSMISFLINPEVVIF